MTIKEIIEEHSEMFNIIKHRLHDCSQANCEADTLAETIGLLRSYADDLQETASDYGVL